VGSTTRYHRSETFLLGDHYEYLDGYMPFSLISVFLAPTGKAAITTDCVAAVTSPGGPAGLAIDTSRSTVWIADYLKNAVQEVDANTCALIRIVGTQTGPDGVAVDGNRVVWVTNLLSNSVSKIDGGTGSYLATIPVGTNPRGIVWNGSSNYLYVANYGSKSVTRINPSNNSTYTVSTGYSGPYFMGVSPTDFSVWVANRDSNNVMMLDPYTLTVTHVISTDSQPQYITSDGANMWVS